MITYFIRDFSQIFCWIIRSIIINLKLLLNKEQIVSSNSRFYIDFRSVFCVLLNQTGKSLIGRKKKQTNKHEEFELFRG